MHDQNRSDNGDNADREISVTATEAEQENHPDGAGKYAHQPTQKRGHPQTFKQKWMAMSLPNKLSIIFSALIFVATSAYAGFSGYQLSLMKRQLRQMQDGSNDTRELAVQAKNQADRIKDVADRSLEQARATNELAKEAKRSADIAQSSLNANRAAFHLDERPWVGLKGIAVNFPLEAGKRIVGQIVMANSGKSFALKTTAKVWIHISETQMSELPHPEATNTSPVTMFPNQEMPMKVVLPAVPKETDITALKNKTLFLYLYARIVYFDVFGKRHQTDMCGIFNGDTDFEACTFHNFAD